MQFHYRHIGAPRGLNLDGSVYRGTSRYQRPEKGANDSRSTWLELRKFRSTAAAPSRKSKYRLQTRKSIPARNIYRRRVTLVTRSFRRNNEVFLGKNWVARIRVSFLSSTLSIDIFIWLRRYDRGTRTPESRLAKEIFYTRQNKFCSNSLAWISTPRELARSGSLFGNGYGFTFRVNKRGRVQPTALQKDIYYSNKDIS